MSGPPTPTAVWPEAHGNWCKHIWRLCGSNRKPMEVGGSQWKEVQKLEVSVESMEVFTIRRWKLQLLRWKVPSTCLKINIFIIVKRFEYSWSLRKLYEDTEEAFRHKLRNLTERAKHQESSFSQIWGKSTGQSRILNKMRAKVYVSCRLSLVSRVCVLLSKREREDMRLS